eukprot:2714393-Pleurochrysis_carterae.AAC.1
MISQLMCECIYTLSSLLSYMFHFLREYVTFTTCSSSTAFGTWDWKAFLEPHFERMSGFCTSQFGSGMHGMYCRKDHNGDVRVWFRQSSQATSWFPDGPSYLAFSSVPDGPPPLALAKPN